MPRRCFRGRCSCRSRPSTATATGSATARAISTAPSRNLSALHPVLAIGLAFSVQEVDAVPAEPHDRPLDLIVTETGILRPLRPERA